MKRYQNPDVYERLAAEYVLGTLHGAARKRFERLMYERPYIRYAVEVWENRFNGLGQTLPAEKPSSQVWHNIQQQIFTKKAEHKQSLLERLGFWQLATGLLSVLLVTAVLLPRQHMEMPEPNFVAVLESDESKPMMVTTGMRDMGMLDVRILEMPKVRDQHLVLWSIPKDGSAPKSVGTLRQDSMETRIHLTKDQWQNRVGDAEMFAVSFEPYENMTNMQKPSGPIMYKGKCLDFI